MSDDAIVLEMELAEVNERIDELERHNELLRAVAVAGQAYINQNWNPHKTMTPESAEANLIRLLQAAIDGGALADTAADQEESE